jgi:hypothetical protein
MAALRDVAQVTVRVCVKINWEKWRERGEGRGQNEINIRRKKQNKGINKKYKREEEET